MDEMDGSGDGDKGLWRMEKGSAGGSGANATDESASSDGRVPSTPPPGLKFGRKIYFEDVVGSGKSPAPAKKGRGGVGQRQQQQQPRCQVEGCNVDLTGGKAYYRRHKVCGMHSKSPKVVVNGVDQRFCQQCSRFHQLHEFDQGKRSCRRRLAGHNERRRKTPPVGPPSSPFHDDLPRPEGFLVPFTHPRQRAVTGDAWPDRHPATTPYWQGPLPSSGGVQTQLPNPFGRRSGGGSFVPNHQVHPGGCVGDPDSIRALSLLSNNPWTAGSRAPVISTNTFAAAPASHSAGSASSPWDFKEPCSSGGVLEIPQEMGLVPGAGPSTSSRNRQFSGEPELAFHQGSSEYDASSATPFHWPL